MKKNEIFRLRAENLGADMEGICRLDGIPVFVPGLLPGEEADVRIVKAEKRFSFGRMESPPYSPSPVRKDPGCAAYPRCGGCSCRHMSYEASLEAKTQQVRDCLKRIGGIDAEVMPAVGMADPVSYRNKTSLPVGLAGGETVLGFYAPRSHSIVPVSGCPNSMPPSDEIASAFLSWARRHHIPPYNENSGTGVLRHLMIRVNRAGESMVTVVANASDIPDAGGLVRALEPLGTVSIWLNENRQKNNVILSDRFHHIYGRKTLTDRLSGLSFELSPGAFFQVNPSQTEILYRTAAEMAAPSPEDTVCDVYCGAGTIALSLADKCSRVIGIEIVPQAVENARANAKANNIANSEFFSGKAEELLPEMVSKGLRPDVIITDPPRKGLDPRVIGAIADAAPKRLVYVSCNPATLARDAGILKERGYTVQKVQPVDMFCWTSGIETVVLMSRKDT